MWVVNSHFGLPFQPYPLQEKEIEALAILYRAGYYAEPGCGKTLMSTAAALYKKVEQPNACTLVIMPPILINGWKRWLEKVKGVGKVVVYRGTCSEREALKIKDADWILMSIQIFKSDVERIERDLAGRPKIGIVDEAHSVKNVGSDNHRKVRDFFAGNELMLLTGTPLSSPGDVYAYVKLISPLIYRSKRQFENVHVEERDSFGKVTKWRRLDLLQENLLNNSCRILKEEMLPYLKTPIYVPTPYTLGKKHMALYHRLMSEQLLVLENGSKIDATTASRLYHAAQQIVTNLEKYSGDEKHRSTSYDVLDNAISELGMDAGSDAKLVVFAIYKETSRRVLKYLQPYGAVACYSEVSPSQQAKNIDRFMSDPSCRILVAQPLSAGYGLNLQEVCSDELFLETPIVPAHFHQGVARVHRDGQTKAPVIRIAIAEGTIQERLHQQLLEKDALVNKIQIGFKDLKEAIYGGSPTTSAHDGEGQPF